jgi:prepilin-type N-terminal cleavage/methylation domain-containing protein
MFRNKMGFTLIELLVVITLIGISLTLAVPSWEQVSKKRRITNGAEQVAAFLATAQSEAQKRNLPVTLSYRRSGDQDWCIGAVLGASGCDCTEADPDSGQFCSVDGNPHLIDAQAFQLTNLIGVMDVKPDGGDSNITFDPIRGILQPAGERLQLTFESPGGYYQLRLVMRPTGLLSICSPDSSNTIGGYLTCSG